MQIIFILCQHEVAVSQYMNYSYEYQENAANHFFLALEMRFTPLQIFLRLQI